MWNTYIYIYDKFGIGWDGWDLMRHSYYCCWIWLSGHTLGSSLLEHWSGRLQAQVWWRWWWGSARKKVDGWKGTLDDDNDDDDYDDDDDDVCDDDQCTEERWRMGGGSCLCQQTSSHPNICFCYPTSQKWPRFQPNLVFTLWKLAKPFHSLRHLSLGNGLNQSQSWTDRKQKNFENALGGDLTGYTLNTSCFIIPWPP